MLKNGETNFGGNTLLLDCATILEARAFDGEEPYSNAWIGSPVRDYLNGEFKTNRFTSREIAAIHESRKSATVTGDGDGGSSLGWASLNGEKIFLLDAKEATNTSYGFKDTDESSTTREKTEANGWWWLRSPFSSAGDYAGCVDEVGNVGTDNVIHDYAGVSPALNVNLASVIFSSEISSKIYKLTIADTGTTIGIQTGESITRESATAITVPYTKDANSNHVSLLVTDANTTWSSTNGWSSGAEKKYYTTAAATGASGTVTFTLPDDFEPNNDSYKVWLLAEKVNGGNATDYASAPLAISVPHWHNFTYTAGTGDQANMITATCKNAGCDITTGLTMTISAPTDLTYDGQPKAAALNADYNKTAFPDTYTISYQGTGDTVYNSTTAPTNAGDYKATVTVGTAVAEVSFTISQAELTITANDLTYEYNGQLQGPGDVVYADPAEIAKMVTAVGLQGNDAITSVVVDGQGKDVGTYELVPSDATVNEVSASKNYDVKYIKGTLRIQLPISYTVTFKVVNGSWNDGTSTDKTVTLTGYEGDMLKLTSDQIPAVGSKPNDTFKAGSWDVTPSTETAITGATAYTYTYSQKDTAVVKTAPTAKALTYTGSAQELITAGTASGGTMQYALGTVTEATQSYTASIPTGTNVGTYYVWYKVIGDANHLDYIALQPIAVTIAAGGETEARMEQRPLDSVPAELAHLYGSVEEIRRDMMQKVSINGEPVKAENTFPYDVALPASFDGEEPGSPRRRRISRRRGYRSRCSIRREPTGTILILR